MSDNDQMAEEQWLDDWTASESPEPERGFLPESLFGEVSAASMSSYDNIGESATADTIRAYLQGKSCNRSVYMTVLHNSATLASDDKGLATVKSFARYHMNNRGWKAIGYHFVIDTKGTIWAGRKIGVLGSHAGAKGNPGSIGVCLIGNLETVDKPTEAQKRALASLHASLCDLFYGGASRKIRFHREFMSTACPGKLTVEDVMGWVNQYRPVTPPVGVSVPIFEDGKPISFATIIGNTSYTPVRTAFENMGFEVEWIESKKVANLTSPGKTPIPIGAVYGTADKPKVFVDGKLAGACIMIGGNTYAPVRAVFEAAGYEVEWKSDGVHISK